MGTLKNELLLLFFMASYSKPVVITIGSLDCIWVEVTNLAQDCFLLDSSIQLVTDQYSSHSKSHSRQKIYING